MKPWSVFVLVITALIVGVWIGSSIFSQREIAAPHTAATPPVATSKSEFGAEDKLAILANDTSREAGLLLAIYATPSGIQRHRRFDEFLQAITDRNWKSILPLLEKARGEKLLSTEEYFLCWQRLGEVGGDALIEATRRRDTPAFAERAMRGWAAKDPAGANAYLEHHPDPDLSAGYVYGIGASHPEAALQAFLRLPADQQWASMTEFAMEPALAPMVAQWLDASSDVKPPGEWTESSHFFGMMFVHSQSRRTPVQQLAWLDRFAGRPYAKADAVSGLGQTLAEAPKTFATSAKWLTRFSARAPETAKETFRSLFSRAGKPTEAVQWLAEHKDHPSYDHAAAGLVDNFSLQNQLDLATLEQLISTITSESVRARAAESFKIRTRHP